MNNMSNIRISHLQLELNTLGLPNLPGVHVPHVSLHAKRLRIITPRLPNYAA